MQRLLPLLLLWPLLGVALAAAGLATAYLAGSWLSVPALIGLVLAGPALATGLLTRLPNDASGFVMGFIYLYPVTAAVVGGLMGHLVARPYLELTRFPPAENLPVQDAVAYASPGYRHFADGRILPERGGTYVESGTDADGTYYEYHYIAAPVISPGWREGDPVTLWVVTGSQETAITHFDTWQAPVQGMTVTRHLNQYRQAVAAAVAAHNLRSDPDALLLRLYEQDYTALQARLRRNMLIFLAVVALFGWVPLLYQLTRRAL